MRNLAIIPARSGSKGLIHKNIMNLDGMPLLGYSVIAAKKSGLFDKVMVSTDSEEYAAVARKCGAEVPFLRSEKNSTDTAGSWDVVEEVLDCYMAQGIEFDNVCLLQPTSPMRTAEDIIGAYQLFLQKDATAVISVCEAEHPPLWSGHLGEDNSLDGFLQRSSNRGRQSYGAYYRLNGALFFVKVPELRKDHFLYREGCYAYVMSREHSVDIDSIMDFRYAEFLMKYEK